MSKSDQKFFRRFQHRTYRVRLSDRDEIESFAIATGRDMTPSPGCRWYTAIRKIGPGLRAWTLALNCADEIETNFTEQQAMAIYHAHMAGGWKRRRPGKISCGICGRMNAGFEGPGSV